MQIFRFRKHFKDLAVIPLDTPFTKIHKMINEFDEKDFILVNETNVYLGMISSRKLFKIKNKKILLASISAITPIRMNQNIGDVLSLLKEKHLDKAPVVNKEGTFIGYLRYHEILELYFEKK